MRYGLIDIGSNTIRGVVYEAEGTSLKELIIKKEFANGRYMHLPFAEMPFNSHSYLQEFFCLPASTATPHKSWLQRIQ